MKDLSIISAITAVAALIGVALGSWITAALATRRERWNLRRELYTSLLQNLGEAQDALESLFRMERASPPDDPEARRRWVAREMDWVTLRQSRERNSPHHLGRRDFSS